MRRKELRIYLPLLVLLLVVTGVYVALSNFSEDTRPPKLTIPEDALSVSVSDPESALLQGITALDNHDGDVTDLILVEKISDLSDDHTAIVTYAAFDRSGNVSKGTRTVRYTDYTSPVFSLRAPLVFQEGTNPDVLGRISASDVIDGDISRNIKAALAGSAASLSIAGTHPVAFRVTNSMGDTVYITVPVDVLPVNTYLGTVNLTANLIYVAQGASFQPAAYFRSLSLASNHFTVADGVKLTVDSDVDTSVPGTYSVAYTATYQNMQAFTRLIVIVE